MVCAGFTQGLALLVPGAAGPRGDHPGHRGVRPAQLTGTRSRASGLALALLPVDDGGAAIGGLPARPARCCSPRRTSSRWARRWPRTAPDPGHRLGAGTPGEWSSRTTTTASSATTASRSAPCRRSRPSTSSTPARPARAWRPACGSAGWCCPPGWLDEVVAARALADRQRQRSTSSPWPSSSRSGRLRPAGPPGPAGLPAAPRPAGRRAARSASAGAGHRHRGRPARAARTAAGQRRGRRWWPARPGTAWPSRGSARTAAPGPAGGPALVVGYGTPPEHAFTGALARLCAVLAE